MKHTIAVSEMFYTIQGEGIFTGRPSFFIRTNFCNLGCHFCDTPFTSLQPEKASRLLVYDLVTEALKYRGRHVVISGGEPTIWRESLPELCSCLMRAGKKVTVETNGSIYLPALIGVDLLSISPKLANSIPEPGSKHYAKHICNMAKTSEATSKYIRNQTSLDGLIQLKFVIDQPEDLVDVDAFLQSLFWGLRPNIFVVLMPQGRTSEECREKASWLVEICKERDWIFSSRLHLDIWGTRRGV